jgi:hypothetical protein
VECLGGKLRRCWQDSKGYIMGVTFELPDGTIEVDILRVGDTHYYASRTPASPECDSGSVKTEPSEVRSP